MRSTLAIDRIGRSRSVVRDARCVADRRDLLDLVERNDAVDAQEHLGEQRDDDRGVVRAGRGPLREAGEVRYDHRCVGVVLA